MSKNPRKKPEITKIEGKYGRKRKGKGIESSYTDLKSIMLPGGRIEKGKGFRSRKSARKGEKE